MPTTLWLDTPQGHAICSQHFTPKDAPKACVIIGAAIGIPQSYYHSFAHWLAEHGYAAVTFDYFGQGQSLTDPINKVKTSVSDWAKNDCASVILDSKTRYPDVPLYWLGHSLGGQIAPLIEGIEAIDKLITVACGSGYWKGNAKPTRHKALLMWYLLMPLLTPFYGYFPGKKMGAIGDLPKNAAFEWRSWCLNPRYAAGVSHANEVRYQRFNKPMTSIAFSDDEMISLDNVKRLNSLFGQANVQLKLIDPRGYGLKRIGHLGFFRKDYQALWQQALLPELSL